MHKIITVTEKAALLFKGCRQALPIIEICGMALVNIGCAGDKLAFITRAHKYSEVFFYHLLRVVFYLQFHILYVH